MKNTRKSGWTTGCWIMDDIQKEVHSGREGHGFSS